MEQIECVLGGLRFKAKKNSEIYINVIKAHEIYRWQQGWYEISYDMFFSYIFKYGRCFASIR